MQAQLQQLLAKFNGLSLRERILVIASFWVILSVVWFNLLSTPVYKKTQQISTEIKSVRATQVTLKQQQQKLILARSQDPHRDIKQRIARLESEITKLDANLKEKLHGLITPKQMVKVLESVLEQHTSLKLVRVKSLPAVPLLAEAEGENNSNSAQDKPVEIYRHGLQIEFEGNFLAALAYLESLEKLSWEFYWDEAQVEVQKYPVSRVVITVHTLSLGKGWIGV